MNALYSLLFIAFLPYLAIGSVSFSNYNSSGKLTDEDEMLYAFVAKAGKKIGEKYAMNQFGMGGGNKQGIWLMALSFQRYGTSLTEESARKLLINCLKDFLALVNQDEKLKPFLKTYPFTAKNIDISIYFYAADRKNICYPFISVVSSKEERIAFYTESEDQFTFKTKKYETYEEAVAILQKEKEQSLQEIH